MIRQHLLHRRHLFVHYNPALIIILQCTAALLHSTSSTHLHSLHRLVGLLFPNRDDLSASILYASPADLSPPVSLIRKQNIAGGSTWWSALVWSPMMLRRQPLSATRAGLDWTGRRRQSGSSFRSQQFRDAVTGLDTNSVAPASSVVAVAAAGSGGL